jgi:hypothetical protein
MVTNAIFPFTPSVVTEILTFTNKYYKESNTMERLRDGQVKLGVARHNTTLAVKDDSESDEICYC